MSCDSAAAIRKLLLESVVQISELMKQHDVTGNTSAFLAFKRAVQYASSGRYATPAELLGDLEHKDAVGDYLGQLYAKRKMFKRQIEAVMMVLLPVDGWLAAWQALELPSELRSMLSDEEAARSQHVEPAPRPALQVKNGSPEVKAAENGSEAKMPATRLAPATLSTLALLEKGRSQIEALSYSASKGNHDETTAAFEVFRRAVVQVVQSPTTDDDDVLELLEPKGAILQFLVDIYECMRKYRARVASVLIRLLAFEGWKAAAEADDSIHAAVHDLIAGTTVTTAERASRVQVTLVGATLTMRTAAETAVSQGGVGAAYVRVVAGHNLIPADSNGSSDPYVRVWLGQRMKRTHIVGNSLNPRWDASSFIMHVPSFDACIRFEALDDDVVSSDPLGELVIKVADLPTELSNACGRHTLAHVAHGELELELLFVPGTAVAAAFLQRTEATPAIQAPEVNPGPLASSEVSAPEATASQGLPLEAPDSRGCRGSCLKQSCSLQ